MWGFDNLVADEPPESGVRRRLRFDPVRARSGADLIPRCYTQVSPRFEERGADEMTDDQLKKILHGIPDQIVEGFRRADLLPVYPVDRPSAPQESKSSQWKRRMQVTASILAIAGVLWAGFRYVISSELKKALEQPNKDFAALRDKDVGGIQKDIAYLRKDVDRILDRQATEVLHGRAGTSRAEDIKEAAVRALDRHIVIDPHLIQTAAATPSKQRTGELGGDDSSS